MIFQNSGIGKICISNGHIPPQNQQSDFAKKHPVNKPKRKRAKASLRAKRKLNQPLKIKHLFFISSFTALVLFSSYYLLKTDVKNLRGGVVNPKIEF